MNPIISNYIHVLKSFANFSGRADRPEYWMFLAANMLATVVLSIIDGILGIPLLGPLYCLIAIVPGIAVSIRRLHDTDRSGWWLLVAVIPFVGFVVLLVLMVLEGSNGPNHYGAKPAPPAAV